MGPLHSFLCAGVLALSFTQTGWAQQNPLTALRGAREFARELITTTSATERTALLAAKKELITIALSRELVIQGNTLLLAGKYSTALDVYTLADSIAAQINDSEGRASAALNIGTVNYFQGNHAAALKYYQEARALFTSLGNPSEAAKALSGLALLHKEQRNDAAALKAYEQVLREFEALDDREEMANTLSSMGSIYYARGDYAAASKAFVRSAELSGSAENVLHVADAFYMQGDYREASEYYQKALREFSEQQNAGGIISALGGAANSNYYLGNYDEALDYYRRDIVAQQAMNDDSGVATSLQGIGNVQRALGDFGAALESYRKSLAVAEGANIKISTAATLGSIGLVRALQGDNKQALEYYAKSLALFETTGDKVGMARMLAQLGNANFAQGNYDLAIESYQKSLTLRISMDDRPSQANLFVGMGTVYLAQRNYTNTRESYEKALTIFESLRNKEAAADVLARIANALFQQGDFGQSLNFAERAATMARQEESLSTVWYARMIAGKAQSKLNQPVVASQSFLEAITTVEALRSQPASTETGSGRSNTLPYLAAIDLAMEQNKAGDAFDYAERAKVQALNDQLRKGAAKITRSMSPEEQAQEGKLVGELVSLDLQIDRETQMRGRDDARIANIKSRQRHARLAYEQLRKRIYAARPQLKLSRGELPPLKLTDLRGLIGDGQTALLEYVITEDKIYLFVLTADPKVERVRTKAMQPLVTLKAYPLNIGSAELVQRTASLNQTLRRRDESYRLPARELYDLLLRPAQDQLAEKSKFVFVPDGILWRLPFEVLQPEHDRYLLNQASVAYVPSLSALREMRKSRVVSIRGKQKVPTLSAFGNPLISKELEQRILVEDDAGRSKEAAQTKIEFSVEREGEVERLRTLYGNVQSRVFVGAMATEEQAKQQAGRPGVLHFATQALMDDASPSYASVALTPGGSKQDDGLLQPWEIANLRSQASLVVVSGASVRQELLGAGNGAIVYAWSWFIAGTPTTVVSRWELNSPAVSLFMSELHARLKKNVPKAEALRQSALTLRGSSEYQHPYFWSAFALIGDGR